MLHRGGHDPAKIYNAYKRAIEHKGGPTVILAKTVKGYGLGSAQARNATHSEKKLADEGLAAFVKRFDIPIPEQAAKDGAFYRPEPDAPEIQYMQERRKAAGRLSAAARGARRIAGSCAGVQGAGARLLQDLDGRLEGPLHLDHHGLCQPAERADEG